MTQISAETRKDVLAQFSLLLAEFATDRECAGLAIMHLLRARRISWREVFDPDGTLPRRRAMAARGSVLFRDTRESACPTMPDNVTIDDLAIAALERCHRIPPALLAEVAVHCCSAETCWQGFGRARDILAEHWTQGAEA